MVGFVTLSVSLVVAIWAGNDESVTWMVKLALPAAVGRPESTPDGERTTPGGSDPEDTDHEYGAMPPKTSGETEAEYELPFCPAGRLIPDRLRTPGPP